jgi:hypothetical protein
MAVPDITPGVFIEYHAVLGSELPLMLSYEAFGFERDRHAHLKAGAEYQSTSTSPPLLRRFYQQPGNGSICDGFSIRFEVDGLEHMLTTTPIPMRAMLRSGVAVRSEFLYKPSLKGGKS